MSELSLVRLPEGHSQYQITIQKTNYNKVYKLLSDADLSVKVYGTISTRNIFLLKSF